MNGHSYTTLKKNDDREQGVKRANKWLTAMCLGKGYALSDSELKVAVEMCYLED